ncbi:hypothetical protein [Cohnella silvisoli]|uniref:LSM domain-containing protein n=1 Tax=Cohnella silvisoli TaxID=2873699 RepID=A0ABV1KWU2_9BACL|nr:hypothetical protein [Cohnella silvisoli]MCD9023878.1 hypothetical protein [Cohnella silvisoli]
MFDSLFEANEESLLPLCGRAVCVIMNDDTRYTGILTSCSPTSIVLNGERTQRPVKRGRKAKIQTEENIHQEEQQNSTSAYWGTLSFGPSMELNTAKAVIPLSPIRAVIAL